jgi:hypothetical protein
MTLTALWIASACSNAYALRFSLVSACGQRESISFPVTARGVGQFVLGVPPGGESGALCHSAFRKIPVAAFPF